MKYLMYTFRNVEPVRIIDDSESQHGENATLKFIPGSTIRGLIVNGLAKQYENFEAVKKLLFSEKIQFLNAYPTIEGKSMIPSPKGFYEDKTITEGKKSIQNVVITGDFDEGMKRASLGNVSYLDGDCIRYMSIKTMSDMKIKINDKKRDVFRNEYICPGYQFLGFIRLEEEIDEKEIRKILEGGFRLGNARSSGLGKCLLIIDEITDALPYNEYIQSGNIQNECYMYLASDMCMLSDNGEPCGINVEQLEEKMGVSDLEVKYASTSKKDIRGYNRNWGGKIASLPVYEKGSVFHLEFSGILTKENANLIMDKGLGTRRNEGFGRVLFLKNYEKVSSKLKIDNGENANSGFNANGIQDKETLKVVATNYVRNALRNLMEKKIVEISGDIKGYKNSQLGIVESICIQNLYQPKEASRIFDRYLEHTVEKDQKQKIHKEKKSRDKLKDFVEKIISSDICSYIGFEKNTVMGYGINELLSEEEKERLKLKLISDTIRYNNKGEVK